MRLLRKILGIEQPRVCALPDDIKAVIDTANQQADDVLDILRRRREKALLNGAFDPGRHTQKQ